MKARDKLLERRNAIEPEPELTTPEPLEDGGPGVMPPPAAAGTDGDTGGEMPEHITVFTEPETAAPAEPEPLTGKEDRVADTATDMPAPADTVTEIIIEAAPDALAALRDTSSEQNEEFARVYNDAIVLLNYALGTGKRMPEKITALFHRNTLDSIVQAYQELSFMIRPAIPKAVLYLEQQRKAQTRLLFIHTIPAVFYFMLTGIVSFLLLIISSCSPLVNESNLAHGLLNSSGWVLFMNLLFVSSVSCLGATFSILPKINWQVRHGTYLPESNMHYWSTLVLGIFGGLIMGELLSLSYDIPGTPMKFDAILFSLLGGFASESVFLILKTVMLKLQQLVAGDAKEAA